MKERFQLMSPVAVEASRMDAGPIVDLFTVRYVDDKGRERAERYTAGPGATASVMYGGQEYRPLPIALEGAGFSASGAAARPTLRVSLLDRTAAPAGWHGARIDRVRTLARYLDGAPEADSSRHWPRESWVVDRLSSQAREEVVWQLSSPLDLEQSMIPRRQVLRDVCQWQYRRRVGDTWKNPPVEDGCPYRGRKADGGPYWNARDEEVMEAAEDVCSRRLSGCRLRFGDHGVLPFGGFAGVSQVRR
ncbi:MAG: phage minor tail protein L [Acidobacteria bacterium]|nr:phage minor tail protein L [Acidobacteriota bacterium]